MLAKPVPNTFKTSAEIAAVMTDETGSGPLVFADSPTLRFHRAQNKYNAKGQSNRFAGNNGFGQGAVGFATPQMSAEVAGTRTSDTLFTRTAGTWIADALVGQYAFSYVAGTPITGIWLPITANTTTTLTINGTLQATGTGVMTCPWNPTQAAYAQGQGAAAFMGACFDGESVWLAPYNSSNLVKVNPATGAMTAYAHGQGAAAFAGACFDGESVWLAPRNSSNLIKVNPATGAMTAYAHGQGADAFTGACFDGESVWLAPLDSSNLIKVNPATGAMTAYAHGQGAAAFMGACFDGESVWLAPYNSSNLVKVNPATGAMTAYAHGQGAAAFAGACFDGESVWLAPRNSSNLIKVNPATGAMTAYAHGQGAGAFAGACFDGESVWLVPYNSSNLVKVNPATGAMTAYAHGQGADAFTGACFDGESIWLAPFYSSNLVKVNPAGFGRKRQHQNWNITASRALNTTYTNPSPDRSLLVMATVRCAITVAAGNAYVQGKADTSTPPTTVASGIVGIQAGLLNEDNTFQICFVVSQGMNYRIDSAVTNGTVILGTWFEINL